MELCGQPQFMDIGFMSMWSSASLHYFAVLCIKAGHAVQVQCRFLIQYTLHCSTVGCCLASSIWWNGMQEVENLLKALP